ncbi:MAG: Stp1/IreP family PP2C-type Ser/Thr phosphatase [Clostridia bacterium]|nr:Stp1/IreP family PP2C-type Ser/Thr phosphatase [Clostridia bacterium]
MRKFNLKGKAAARMIETSQEVSPVCTESATKECPVPGFSVESRTDVGRVRKSNQDALILGCGVAGVADGMGGHNGGEIASGETRDGILQEIRGKKPDRNLLEETIKKVNLQVWEKQEHDATLTGMGTTLTLLWPAEHEMIIAQVGDSRAYLIRDGEMRQVTEDHSLVGDMVRRGVLTEEQAACHPMRNYITRAVGTDDTVEVDLFSEPRKKGDRWLICSDGLYGQMTREKLQELALTENAAEAADLMLQNALDNGGKDNISLILLTDETENVLSGEQDTGEAVPAEDNGEARE